MGWSKGCELRSTFRSRPSAPPTLLVSGEADPAPRYAVVCDQIPRSLYSAALEQALVHKWIESQKQGCDLGQSALKDWFRKHWLPFCRSCRLEHVEGRQQWIEFAEHEFGQVYQLIMGDDLLCDRVLDRMEHGYDNLEIINWALHWGLEMDPVLALLELIDINRARLEPIALT
jgi:hypothetical protein